MILTKKFIPLFIINYLLQYYKFQNQWENLRDGIPDIYYKYYICKRRMRTTLIEIIIRLGTSEKNQLH